MIILFCFFFFTEVECAKNLAKMAETIKAAVGPQVSSTYRLFLSLQYTLEAFPRREDLGTLRIRFFFLFDTALIYNANHCKRFLVFSHPL